MHKKYAKEGLVAITLSLDFARDEKTPVERGLKKLRDRKVDLINYIIQESPEFLKEKLRYEGQLPMIYVFNRQGKWKLFQYEDVNYQVIDQTVKRFLQEK